MKELVIDKTKNGTTIDGSGEYYDKIVFMNGTKDVTVTKFKTARITVTGTGHKIIGNEVRDGRQSGIFVAPYSSSITITDNKISNCFAVGIYLDHHTSHNTVKNNSIKNCGYWFSLGKYKFPRWWWEKREGIAVDDSSDNTIIGNHIEGCGFAGITLYRNCGEFGTEERGEGANRNIVSFNTLVDVPVGIWNAARAKRDLVMWGCDEPHEDVPLKKLPKMHLPYWLNPACILYPFQIKSVSFKIPIRFSARLYKDYAIDNVFEGNTFVDCKTTFIDWNK